MVRVIPLPLHSYITKVHKSVGYGWGKGKGWVSLSSPLHRKVTIYLYKKSVRNIQKIKYPRIFNEIIADTRWNIHGYVMKYPRIFEEFGKADGIISPIGQTLDTLLATFLCAAGDNGRVFSLTLSSSSQQCHTQLPLARPKIKLFFSLLLPGKTHYRISLMFLHEWLNFTVHFLANIWFSRRNIGYHQINLQYFYVYW